METERRRYPRHIVVDNFFLGFLECEETKTAVNEYG